ncbi:hypothetical protein [Streptomyces smyrnaeus]|nr:hypothetical protein [Streptomyces smyrnaeus]
MHQLLVAALFDDPFLGEDHDAVRVPYGAELTGWVRRGVSR